MSPQAHYIGQLKCFAFSRVPRGWVQCNGQLLQISNYTDLFSVIKTTYGGDGKTDFAVPDLQGRVPIHQGTGTDLSERKVGEMVGAETVQMTESELPAHSHNGVIVALGNAANTANPMNMSLGSANIYVDLASGLAVTPNEAKLASGTVQTFAVGGGNPHDNMQPSLVLNWCMATDGVFPSET